MFVGPTTTDPPLTVPTSFPAFLDHLAVVHGEDAAAARHEIFFQLQRRWPRSRAVAALVRDAVLLWLWPGRRLRRGEAEGVLFAATLPGANGWRCLEPAMAAVRMAGLPAAVVVHPRLGQRGSWLPRPPFPALLQGLAVLLRHGRNGDGGLPALPVAAAMARRVLWRAAWRAALSGRRGVVVVHNDFDMMSAAAIGQGWPTVCLQHGVPTDEFFPARADLQVVWGDSSAAVYRIAGCGALVVDALGRGLAASTNGPPLGIALVSQSHAAVYGGDFAHRFRALAEALPAGTRVLLHPGECPDHHCYHGLTHLVLERPPHALLSTGEPRHLVVGFCSTALLDAARAGHDVLGLDWPVQDSTGALSVAAPPHRVTGAAAVIEIFHRLRQDTGVRAAFAGERKAWLGRTFSLAEGGLVTALRQRLAP